MSLDVNGYAVLRTVGSQPRLFPDVAVEAKKAARTLVLKQLKAKSCNLASLRGIRKALGEETFILLLDGLKDAEVKTLVTRFDKHNPELKTAQGPWRRERLDALSRGKADPVAKQKPAGKQAAKKKSAKAKPAAKKAAKKSLRTAPDFSDRLYSKAMAAIRRR